VLWYELYANLIKKYDDQTGGEIINTRMSVVLAGVFCLSVSGFAFALGIPESNVPNLNNDEIVDFDDFVILAGNWWQTGAGLRGDLDDSGTVDTYDLVIFCWYWLAQYSEYQQCQTADLDSDGIIAFEDMAKFAQNWLETGEGFASDFDDSNSVDFNDLSVLAECWLQGSRPLCVWEQFKTALAVGDINTTLTFIAEISRDKYAEIFQIIEPNLPDYVADMGTLILESQEEGKVKYEMKHRVGAETYLFPVIFMQEEQGSWKIYNF